MTVTDIPGITAISEFQDDVEQATQSLTTKYIEQENMIVLVVIPGWEDFSNPKALRLAIDNDPEGKRTIGIVTKVDVLPDNSDIVQKIQMARPGDVKLAQGFIAVRNRTKDEDKLTNEQARELEKNLFRNKSPLNQLSKDQWGVDTVVQKIVSLQGRVVNAFIPELLSKLKKSIRALEKELKNLPEILDTVEKKRTKMTMIQFAITTDYSNILIAKSNFNEKQMNICARFDEFTKTFKQKLQDGLPEFLGNEYYHSLQEEIKEIRGINLSNFLSGPLFTRLINNAFADPVEEGTETLLNSTSQLVLAALKVIFAKQTHEYPRLCTVLEEIANEILNEQMAKAEAVIEPLLEAENAISLTLNDKYMENLNSFKMSIQFGTHRGDDTEQALDTGVGMLSAVLREFVEKSVEAANKVTDVVTGHSTDIYEMQLSLKCYATLRVDRTVDLLLLLTRFFLLTGVQKQLFEKLQQVDISSALDPNTDILRKKANIEVSLGRLRNAQIQIESIL